MRELSREQIYDGRTQELNARQSRYFKSLVEENRTELTLEHFAHPNEAFFTHLEKMFENWKGFPKYRYIIHVLIDFFALDWIDTERFFSDIEAINEDGALTDESQKYFDVIVDCLQQRIDYVENEELQNLLETKYTKEVIAKNILDMTEEFFLQFFAPICNADELFVDFFLMRVFKRDALCYYNSDEFLLGKAIEIREKMGNDILVIDILYKLKGYYETLSDDLSEEIPDLTEGTEFIRNMTWIEGEELQAKSNIFDIEEHPGIKTILEKYKKLARPSKRERKEKYKKLFDRVYEDNMDNIKYFVRENGIDWTEEQDGEGKVTLYIGYDSRAIPEDEPVRITKNNVVVGKNANYRLDTPVLLTHQEYVKVCVHVKPFEDNSLLSVAGRRKFVDHLEICSNIPMKNGKPVMKESVTICSMSKELQEEAINLDLKQWNSNEWSKPKWRTEDYRSKSNGEKNYNGFVVLEVMAGEKIPEDLCFERAGFKFRLLDGETKKCYLDEKLQGCYAVKKVDAYLIRDMVYGYEKKTEIRKGAKIFIIDGSDSIRNFLKDIPAVLRVSNKKNRTWVFQENFEQVERDGNKTLAPKETKASILENKMLDEYAESIMTSSEKTILFSEYMYGFSDYENLMDYDLQQHNISDKNMTELQRILSRKTVLKQWLEDSKILGNEDWFDEQSSHRQRCIILTLCFLNQLKKIMDYKNRLSSDKLIKAFRVAVKAQLADFYFDGLYIGYPLDALLVFLLSFCDPFEACDCLRVLYKSI